MAGVHHHDAVIGYEVGELGGETFRAHRDLIRLEQGGELEPPVDHVLSRDIRPGPIGLDIASQLDHALEGGPNIGVDRDLGRIIPTQGLGVDVDLDDTGAERRHLPEMGGHASGLGAHEEDQVGVEHDPVGRCP